MTCCHSGTGRCSDDDHLGVAAHGVEPVAELLGVADRRRQRDDERTVVRQVDDHLFPDGAAEPVGQVVHLVHDDVAEAARASASPA